MNKARKIFSTLSFCFLASVTLSVAAQSVGYTKLNVKSRVQMKLYEAKVRAREELGEALERHGVTVEEVRSFAAEHPKLLRPTQRLPDRYVSNAANFVEKVARQMPRHRVRKDAAERSVS